MREQEIGRYWFAGTTDIFLYIAITVLVVILSVLLNLALMKAASKIMGGNRFQVSSHLLFRNLYGKLITSFSNPIKNWNANTPTA
jgi:hypothetical protein